MGNWLAKKKLQEHTHLSLNDYSSNENHLLVTDNSDCAALSNYLDRFAQDFWRIRFHEYSTLQFMHQPWRRRRRHTSLPSIEIPVRKLYLSCSESQRHRCTHQDHLERTIREERVWNERRDDKSNRAAAFAWFQRHLTWRNRLFQPLEIELWPSVLRYSRS